MRLLLDTDAFCKLAAAGLLDVAARLLGVSVLDCVVLPALPHMLRRGTLVRTYGADTCEAILAIADNLQRLDPVVDNEWLVTLARIADIDPGEAQLIAAVAESDDLLVTGDSRAVVALGQLGDLAQELSRKIVTLPALFLTLVRSEGAEEVAVAVEHIKDGDGMVRICFADVKAAEDALASYASDLARRADPLQLWTPADGGGRS